MFQQCGSEAEAERPGLLFPGGEVGQDACGEVAHLHLRAVEQRADVVQESLHHQLPMQLPDLRYVVLEKRGRRRRGRGSTKDIPKVSHWVSC